MGMAQKLLENAMDVENYSPQVARLLVEWEQDRAPVELAQGFINPKSGHAQRREARER
jgi:hypothetical protein